MPSERARTALNMRRGGAIYKDIGLHLGTSTVRARKLVLQALLAEARREGRRQPTEAEFESIKYRRKRPV